MNGTIEQFKFDTVADHFNEHLTGQLPWYNSFMDGMLKEIASFFIRSNSTVYDFGCSTGNVQKRINDILEKRSVNFLPVENNKSMIDNYWNGMSQKVINADLTKIQIESFSFATSILSMSFIHPFFRHDLIENIKQKCEKGGAVLFLEKFENRQGKTGTIFNRITWANKIDSGQSIESIVNKEIGLSGVQFPLSEKEVNGMELVYCYGDFRAYLFIKPAQGC